MLEPALLIISLLFHYSGPWLPFESSSGSFSHSTICFCFHCFYELCSVLNLEVLGHVMCWFLVLDLLSMLKLLVSALHLLLNFGNQQKCSSSYYIYSHLSTDPILFHWFFSLIELDTPLTCGHKLMTCFYMLHPFVCENFLSIRAHSRVSWAQQDWVMLELLAVLKGSLRWLRVGSGLWSFRATIVMANGSGWCDVMWSLIDWSAD